MAASKAELQTIISQWKTRLPGLTENQYLKLAAIQGGEGGLASTPEGHRYSATNKNLENSFTGSAGVKAKHAEAVAAIKADNKVIQEKNKLITDPKKKLEEKPIPATKQWLRQWNDDLFSKAEAGTISREEHRKQFFDVVYGDKGGADYAGIGDFQVTGKQNTIDALKAYGGRGLEFAKILENDPTAINSLKKNPDFLEAANVGWIKKDLIKTGIINKDMRAVANAVNQKEVATNKANKVATYTGLVKDVQTKLGVTADGDWGTGTEKAFQTYKSNTGEVDRLTKRYPPQKEEVSSDKRTTNSASSPPISDTPYPEVSDRHKMELLSKPNVNSPDGVRRVQAQIGADVDGIWGKQSQDLFDMHNRQAYDNKVRPPSDTYRQEGFQRQAPRKTSLLEQGVNAIVPSAQAAAMPVAPPEKQYATMEDLLIDKDLMQNPMLFNDEDAKRMWLTF
tara:strand:+ start:329 stop:1681 length:1353 start_codon:yes stop_codon:yes gene_type:complete